MAQEGEESLALNSALQELGMLSQASPLRADYLSEREKIKYQLMQQFNLGPRAKCNKYYKLDLT